MQEALTKVVVSVRHYLESRLNDEPVSVLSEIIREMRILLQQTMTDQFLPLPLDKAREFRVTLTDQLQGLCSEMNADCGKDDAAHHHYCVREVITCFEWAEQIKEEVPDDILTQKVLAIDIPILRPFDYGKGKAKPVPPPR